MSVTKTILFPPSFIESEMPIPLQRWLQSVQNLLPLNVCDTTSGPITVALPPAGVNPALFTTGASNQNQEITFVKSSADGNGVTITGAQGGPHFLSSQYDALKFKSDGTDWWKSGCCLASSGPDPGSDLFEDSEVPGGAVDGFNQIFTLAKTPSPASSIHLYLNGLRQVGGWSITGSTITFDSPPPNGFQIIVDYRYVETEPPS